jgi:uncharacterized membrane protein
VIFGEAFYILLIGGVVLGPLVMSIIALVKVSRLRRDINGISVKLARMERNLSAPTGFQPESDISPPVHTAPAAVAKDEIAGDPATSDGDEAAGAAPDAADSETPAEVTSDDGEAGDASSRPPDTDDEMDPASAAPRSASTPASLSLEQKLTSRWIVWLGAFMVALSGIFLVKYASDSGLLGPGVRVMLGVLMGLSLAVAGEVIRRHPEHGRYLRLEGSYIAPALSSAGVFVAFSSVYAAYALYDLIPSLLAFAALAAIALLAFGLSLLQGPFVALLGIVGAYVTPLLISTAAPSAWNLFAYLLVITAASFALVRYRSWWWLSFAAIAGATLWGFLWLITENEAADAVPSGVYLLGVLAIAIFFWRGVDVPERAGRWYTALLRLKGFEYASWLGAIAVAFLLPIYVETSGYTAVPILVVAVACVTCGWRAREVEHLEGLLGLLGLVVLAVLAAWRLDIIDPYSNPFPLPGGTRFLGPVLAPELVPFVWTAAGFAGLFGVGGFLGATGARRTAIWAGASVFVPILILVLVYLRAQERVPDINWSFLAVGLAAVFLYPARWFNVRREAGTALDALGLYAAGVVAALGFAVAMIFEKALLTVALSAFLPALAWLHNRLNVPLLRWVAAVVAGVVLARLTLNWNILDYPLGADFATNWVLYGYGVPALAFFVAAREFKKSRDDNLVSLLEGGTLLFFTLLVSLEIRTFVEGSLSERRYGLLEASLQSASWLVIATSRIWACRHERRFVALWGGRILLVLGLAQCVFGHIMALNPIATQASVGTWPLFNVLTLAYLLPGALILLASRYVQHIGFAAFKLPMRVLGFVMIFLFITLEVQRWFQGEFLSGAPQSDAELYTYSLVWLIFALVLLALGIFSGARGLRYAALFALLATVLKVFLYDMAGLTGLWRVASVLGLGLCLIGIGYLYRRFVFWDADPQENGDATPPDDAGEGRETPVS